METNMQTFPEEYHADPIDQWVWFFKCELRRRYEALNKEQLENSKLLEKGIPIQETTIFFNNGQMRMIEEILGEDPLKVGLVVPKESGEVKQP